MFQQKRCTREDTSVLVPEYRIFIVDDHPLIRRGYKLLIDCEPDMVICGEAASGVEALEKIPLAAPDLVITDLSMDGMDGLELTATLHEVRPALPILISSTYEKELFAARALQLGAHGYIQKSELMEEGLEAIRCLLGGTHCENCPYVL